MNCHLLNLNMEFDLPEPVDNCAKHPVTQISQSMSFGESPQTLKDFTNNFDLFRQSSDLDPNMEQEQEEITSDQNEM